MHKVTDKYGLRQHCRFYTSLEKAEWDADEKVWRIETRNVRTGETQVTCATALIPAIGVLLIPKLPKLQGIESFKGALFHSARWRHDVDLNGKRVGVLGNGSSAYVVLPHSQPCNVQLLFSDPSLSRPYQRTLQSMWSTLHAPRCGLYRR